MEKITIQITLASGEVVMLELSGPVTLVNSGSREISFTGQGDVSLKVVDQGNRVTHVQATPVA